MTETGFEFLVVKLGLNRLFCGTVGIFLKFFICHFPWNQLNPRCGQSIS
jgi:hypothetical protein